MTFIYSALAKLRSSSPLRQAAVSQPIGQLLEARLNKSVRQTLDAIDAICTHDSPDFDQRLRTLYLDEYSYEAANVRLQAIMALGDPLVQRKSA